MPLMFPTHPAHRREQRLIISAALAAIILAVAGLAYALANRPGDFPHPFVLSPTTVTRAPTTRMITVPPLDDDYGG
jgi:hypothetical protein